VLCLHADNNTLRSDFNWDILIDSGNVISIFSTTENIVSQLDKATKKVDSRVMRDVKHIVPEEGFVFAKKLSGDKIIAFRKTDCCFLIWENGTEKRYPIRMRYEEVIKNEKNKIHGWRMSNGMPCYLLDSMVGIEEYIDYVLNLEMTSEERSKERYKRSIPYAIGEIGKNIHNIIKDLSRRKK